MKVLVTGGAGFIGSHIVDQLLTRGDQVVVIDNLITGDERRVRAESAFYNMDIGDPRLVDVLNREKVDAVIHQAAQNNVPDSIADTSYDAKVNIMGTIHLLEACRQADVRKIVYASSAALYGNPAYLPIDEDHPVSPLSPYGISKRTAEDYLQVFGELYGLAWTSLRYANVFGARQDLKGEGAVIPIFMDKLLHGETLRIEGDGEQTRDYIYVEDVAAANILALEYGDQHILNIGTGVQTSLNQLVKEISEVTAMEMEIKHVSARVGDIRHSYFAVDRAEQVLNWSANINLRQGLERAFAYYRQKQQEYQG
ncbi:NAD-dependent epimerase/dehydratase family protein [Mechercharimyces sp. CAU 1602]|uniref:NAD-dependent epimerase/dehydratase family protein n=1 Tax=Mechercharimyces sp. CAU 1602 TaxID=2973933 RepID=UPI00216263E6|nr:NAD-dependent epimerase/dehydratase family protein [Mechercharimyces sp. CAU 1602]MCS1352247.1 NAD-dependent epimerase/dehydratase family protein [Mechercharimyces sp. CAU 1602]